MTRVKVWKVNFNGQGYRLEPMELPEEAGASLDSISRLLPGGTYTTFRTFDHDKVFRLSDHLQRLKTSAQLIGRNGMPFSRTNLREALTEIAQELPAEESRIRLTMDLQQQPGAVYISTEKLKPPSSKSYRTGVHLVTSSVERHSPKAKTTDFIKPASEVRQLLPDDVEDALIVTDAGRLLEGTSSNFFAIKGKEIWTADENVLPGITRSMVLEEAEKAGYPIHLEPITVDDIPLLDEAFITSSSRGVLPVVMINDHTVGTGSPGPVTEDLERRYQQRLEAELEKI